jgi:hypothetical protein
MAITRDYIDAERSAREAWARAYMATREALALEAVLHQRVTTGDLQESLTEYDASVALLNGADAVIRQSARGMTATMEAVQAAGAAMNPPIVVFRGMPVPVSNAPE